MSSSREVLICGEVLEGKVATITKELLNIGRKLCAALNQPLSNLFIGRDIQEPAKESIYLGADKVYLIDGPPFAETTPDFYLALIVGACQQIEPSIILFGQTDLGRELAPRLAAKLKTPVCLDCINLALDLETKQLLQTKPVYGGNALAVWVSELEQPQVITLRPRSVAAAEPDTSRQGEIIPISIEVRETELKSKLVEVKREEVKGIKLEEAKVIVAGGGGIGGPEGFKMLEELARVLGGAVGVTRVPCDEGWMPLSLEIGQTGRVVNPDLYLAVGISGAVQHMAGCSGSKCIVAINKDPNAHIFAEADFGIVRDYREVVPALLEKFKELQK